MKTRLTCPCCGAATDVKSTLIDDEFHTITYAGKTIFLSPRLYQFFTLLHHTLPKPTYLDWICENMGCDERAVRRHAMRLRKKIANSGLKINVQNKRYLLQAQDVREMCANKQNLSDAVSLDATWDSP